LLRRAAFGVDDGEPLGQAAGELQTGPGLPGPGDALEGDAGLDALPGGGAEGELGGVEVGGGGLPGGDGVGDALGHQAAPLSVRAGMRAWVVPSALVARTATRSPRHSARVAGPSRSRIS